MATPHVTGAVALCLEVCGPQISPRRIRDLVLNTCQPNPDSRCERVGRGYLDIPALVDAAHHLEVRSPS
jgi:hypothetical protein